MKKILGYHLYININNLNAIVKKEEENNENLKKTFHKLDTFFATIENYVKKYDFCSVEKLTSSRVHLYFQSNDSDDGEVINAVFDTVLICSNLADYLSEIGKYSNVAKYQIGMGLDYGDFTIFDFEDENINEVTSIGSPANRAAKLQSVCNSKHIFISGEVYEQLDDELKNIFYGAESMKKTALKYPDLSVYQADINDIEEILSSDSYEKNKKNSENYAYERANNTNLSEVTFHDCYDKISFETLSLKNNKSLNGIMCFADIRGFTKKFKSDGSNLGEMKQLTQIVLSKMYKCVNKEDGVHVQFQGDRESAVFHKFTDEGKSAIVRAMRCALRIVDEIKSLNTDERFDKIVGENQINVGIGCDVGDLYATRLGIKSKKDNVVLGETVLSADRMEDDKAGNDKRGQLTEVAITKECYDMISNDGTKEANIIKMLFKKRDDYYVTSCGMQDLINKLQRQMEESNYKEAKRNTVKPWSEE